MILAAIVMVINQKFFISGFKSLWHRAPNMDTLVAMGSTGIVCMECLCTACNDKSAGRRKYGCRYELYDGFLFRIRSDDSDPDYSRKNVRSKIKGSDNGCIKESDEACTENSRACKRWKRSNGFYLIRYKKVIFSLFVREKIFRLMEEF